MSGDHGDGVNKETTETPQNPLKEPFHLRFGTRRSPLAQRCLAVCRVVFSHVDPTTSSISTNGGGGALARSIG